MRKYWIKAPFIALLLFVFTMSTAWCQCLHFSKPFSSDPYGNFHHQASTDTCPGGDPDTEPPVCEHCDSHAILKDQNVLSEKGIAPLKLHSPMLSETRAFYGVLPTPVMQTALFTSPFPPPANTLFAQDVLLLN